MYIRKKKQAKLETIVNSRYARKKVMLQEIINDLRTHRQGKFIDRSPSPAGTHSSGAHILREAHPTATEEKLSSHILPN